MTLVFYIPPVLRTLASGNATVTLDAPPADVPDVATALRRLFALHPGLRDRVTDERDQVRRHVNVFLGVESIQHTGGLATPLPVGAAELEISIVPAVSGGMDLGEPSWA